MLCFPFVFSPYYSDLIYMMFGLHYVLFSFCFNAFLHRACTHELFKLSYTISQFWLLICQRSSIEYFSPVFKHNYASSGVAEFFLYLFIYLLRFLCWCSYISICLSDSDVFGCSVFQVDCLQVDGVLQRRNLVYCASTRYFLLI